MATISFSDKAPPVDGKVHFSFGQSEFDLEAGGSVEVSDASVATAAAAHPWLTVKFDEVQSEAKTPQELADAAAASTDPHVNPAADHLSAEATQEVKDAAVANDAAVRAATADAPVEPAEEAPATSQLTFDPAPPAGASPIEETV